jgi:carbamoyltransferase
MVYTAVSNALGFERGQENRTMWLASTGQDEFQALFEEMLWVDKHGLPRVMRSFFTDFASGSPRMSERFFKLTGLTGGERNALSSSHRNVAASLQSRMTAVMCEIVIRHLERTRQENVCLAGGVALNSVMNAAVEQYCGFERVFVEPVAGNAGASLGAALYVWHLMLGGERRPMASKSLFLGPSYDDQAIKSVLDNCKVSYKYCLTEDRQLDEVAQLLSRGMTVAWFRGATEFGPRALGARCILASPATEMMRDNLNRYIKHREDFRPFCAAVPRELANEFFEPSGLTSLLQAVCRVRPDKRERIPAAVFGRGVARVHTIVRKENQTLWKLLMKFGAITGTPVLLSTSFNLFGEPLVCSPREAVRGFYSSGVDCMVIGSFLINKQERAERAAAGSTTIQSASYIC